MHFVSLIQSVIQQVFIEHFFIEGTILHTSNTEITISVLKKLTVEWRQENN